MSSKLAIAVLAAAAATPLTVAIDNGLGLLPPMGWRSWNCYHGDVTQQLMENVMDVMASRQRTVDGKPTSLLDLGYTNCGLDDNWQACGAGALGGFHDATGAPIVNVKTFPNMSAMTDHGHKLGLRVGWYMNNCICGEHQYNESTTPSTSQIMEQSAAAVAGYGFDGVKLDGCSEFRNLTWWASLLNATGRPILIENCHWGGTIPGDTTGDGPCSGTTTPSDCPYNFFRTSGDISPNWNSMFGNLQTTTAFSSAPVPLSRPGTWAYPDMLEVGNMPSYEENRAHFAAWCIISAPLVLGLDLTNNATVDSVWDIIANPEAIAVNQAWAGDPGHLVSSWSPVPANDTTPYAWAVKCDATDATQSGFTYDPTTQAIKSAKGDCLDSDSATQGTLEFKTCGTSVASQQFTLAGTSIQQDGKCMDVFDFKGPVVQMYGCNSGSNQQLTWNPDGKSRQLKSASGQCLAERPGAPSEGPSRPDLQLWAKLLPGGTAAALVINGDTTNHASTIKPKDLGLSATGTFVVRDIFNRKDIATVGSEGYATDTIEPHDSRFVLFTPKTTH